MKFCMRCASAGWLSGACVGLGAGLFPWANPYVALSLVLGGAGLWFTVCVAIRDGVE